MLKPFLFLSLILLTTIVGVAQPKEQRGKSQLISSGINFPVGNFSKSHSLGAGLEYSWSKNRFGWLNKKPNTTIGLTFSGAANYYFGRNDKTSPPPGFKFKNLLYLHASAGAIYNPCNKATISLAVGPAAEIYSDNASLGLIVNLGGSYFINKKIGITPAISYMKQAEANALWVAALKASILLK
jgi:hypothetical protein